MDIKTFRARTMQDALHLVRQELGPDAAVLHTRQIGRGGPWQWLFGRRQVEVTASAHLQVPSRLPARVRQPAAPAGAVETRPAPLAFDYRAQYRDDLKDQLSHLQSMVEDLCDRTARATHPELPEALFKCFTDMIEADVTEETARELIDRVRAEVEPERLLDTLLVKSKIARIVEAEITVTGPIRIEPGRRTLVALVGPTGVGKTTTIAKLAANYRLREKKRVGLITVDTYRIAAVDQLRTYADIIDLPMEVVATPRQLREASARLADLDLVLLDTAGRSPRDDVQIQELRSMLAEAKPDQVHLVLSAVASAKSLASISRRFAEVGTTAVLLTKLDEAAGLGSLLELLRTANLPLSYLTDGQNVPDDIAVASAKKLASAILGSQPTGATHH